MPQLGAADAHAVALSGRALWQLHQQRFFQQAGIHFVRFLALCWPPRPKLMTERSVTVRRGVAEDLEAIVQLQLDLARETENGLELDRARVAAGVGAGLAGGAGALSPRYWVAVSASSGTVVGCVGVSPEWSDWWNCAYWWIISIFVGAGHRRHGVASELLRVLLAASDEDGVQTVNLRVEAENDGARAFYAAAGFATDTSHVVMSRGRKPDGAVVGTLTSSGAEKL